MNSPIYIDDGSDPLEILFDDSAVSAPPTEPMIPFALVQEVPDDAPTQPMIPTVAKFVDGLTNIARLSASCFAEYAPEVESFAPELARRCYEAQLACQRITLLIAEEKGF